MTILEEWQRLIFPPDAGDLRGGEQLADGNRYPDVDHLDLDAHLEGRKTYAVNLAWSTDGKSYAKAGVLDIDEGAESIPKAKALYDVARANGLRTALEWSGRKGCHVWIFSEPVPLEVMRGALKRLRAAVQHQGEAVPLDAQRVKLAPGYHREGRGWQFFYAPGDTPEPMAAPPAGFLEGQADLLSDIEPTPANVLYRYAALDTGNRADPADTIPALDRLDGQPAPCMQALLKRGGTPELMNMNRNLLTVARYARAAGLDQDAADQLVAPLIEAPAEDLETGKSEHDRRRNWESQQDSPTLDQEPFNCLYMLGARKSLGFNCARCPARPKGVRLTTGTDENSKMRKLGQTNGSLGDPMSLVLERTLADQLLAYVLTHGYPPQAIDPAVFPTTAVDDVALPLHGLVWRAGGAGAIGAAAVATWLDRLAYQDLVDADTYRTTRHDPDQQAPIRRALTEATTSLVGRLLSEDLTKLDLAALVSRAADLSAKRALDTTLTDVRGRLVMPGQDLLGAIQDLHQTTTTLQRARAADFGAPLTAYAPELLEGLIRADVPSVPTPFAYLNGLLGGGLRGGKLYVLGAPPGGGKTTLAAQLADTAAEAGVPTAFVAFEMGRGQLFDYALARAAGLNSAIIEARSFRRSEEDQAGLVDAANGYLEVVAPNLSVIEADYFTTTAQLAGWSAQARARYGLAEQDPVLIVVDYLQLMNTGQDGIDSQPHETPRVSQVAVQLKQLARQTGAAVLALSDITKDAQGGALTGGEITLNAFRGSNRIAHAADCAMALYSEQPEADGGKALADPWDVLADRLKENRRALPFLRGMEDAKGRHKTGGPGAAVYARLELLKNRGGQGRGNQLMVYERAYHRFQAVEVAGQAEAEGRG